MIIRTVAADGVREVPLPAAGVFSVGRRQGNDLVIDDMSVSRQHALLRIEDGRIMLENASSKGTQLNGEKISDPVEVCAGDVVELGDVRLELVDDAAAGHVPVPVVPAQGASAFLYTDEMIALQRRIHAIILTRLNAGAAVHNLAADRDLAERAEKCLGDVLYELKHEIPDSVPEDVFRQAMLDELLDLGPIAPFVRDREVSEIMVNGPDRIFVEKRGLLSETGARFMNEQHLVQVIKRIVEPIGRHVDESSPMVDARLKDGSRVNAIIAVTIISFFIV